MGLDILLQPDDALSGWIPWVLWIAAVAAWCGFSFDGNVASTGVARGVMWAALGLTGLGALITWKRPEAGFRSRFHRLWFAAALTGLTLFACGFFLADRTFRMYVTPKIAVLYPAAALLFGWWMLQWTRAPTRRMLLRHPLTWLFVGMAAHLLINTVVSDMPAVTFFGSINRQMGVVTLFACMAVALVLTVWISREKERARWVLFGWMAVSLFLFLRTYYELTMPGVRVFRPSGFAGNPDFFALQFHFSLFPALALFFSDKSRKVAAFCALVVVTNVFALATIQTRGAWLGLGIASTVSFFVFSPARFLELAELRLRLLFITLALAFGLALHHLYLVTVLPPHAELAKLPPDVAKSVVHGAERMLARHVSAAVFVLLTLLPILARGLWDAFPRRSLRLAGFAGALAAAALVLVVPSARQRLFRVVDKAVHLEQMLDPDEGEARFRVWKDTVPMVREHFLTGVGREVYRVGFLPYKSLELTAIAPGVNYRSSHNLVLDLLAMEGIVGLVAMFSLLGWGIFFGLRRARRTDLYTVSPPLFGMSLALVGYLGHSLVVYDVIPSVFGFYAALGVIGGLLARAEDAGDSTAYFGLKRPAWLLLVPLLLAVPVTISMVGHVRSDQALTRIQRSAAILKGYMQVYEPIQTDRARLAEVERLLAHPSAGSLGIVRLRTLAESLRLPTEKLSPDVAVALVQLRQATGPIREALQRREAELSRKAGDRSRSAAQALIRDLGVIHRTAGPGESLYNAAHAAHVLTRLPEGFLAPHDRMDVLRLLLRTAQRGVPDNTNPESAYSRLFTAHYALARAFEDAGRVAEAHSQYQKSLHAIQKSIDFDRLYYDTHRLKAVLLLEHFCDAEGARKELDVSLLILRRARPSKQVKDALVAIENGPMRQLEAWDQSPAVRQKCLQELARVRTGSPEPLRKGQ
jgi:tetratricopeptide (TPR) repeat protein